MIKEFYKEHIFYLGDVLECLKDIEDNVDMKYKANFTDSALKTICTFVNIDGEEVIMNIIRIYRRRTQRAHKGLKNKEVEVLK